MSTLNNLKLVATKRPGALPQIVQRRRLMMAQHRFSATCEHRRHPATVQREPGMAHRIDAPMDPEQPTTLAHAADRRHREPQRCELPGGDHTVLVRGQPRQGCVD